jgi:hypothetical protein
MAKMKKPMKPKFFYDKQGEKSAVYLTIQDYKMFTESLQKFSDKARAQAKKTKSKP